MKKEVRELNFANAQVEVSKVIEYLEEVKSLYLKPLKLEEETNALNRSINNLDKIIKRLTKRIEISKKLKK